MLLIVFKDSLSAEGPMDWKLCGGLDEAAVLILALLMKDFSLFECSLDFSPCYVHILMYQLLTAVTFSCLQSVQ